MKPGLTCLFWGLAALLGGCHTLEAISQDPYRDQPFDSAVVSTLMAEGVTNAVVRQRTLDSSHFLAGQATLSELGRQDLTLLADYYQQHPGPLELHVGGTDAPRLLAARERAATDFLASQGVPQGEIALVAQPEGSQMMAGQEVELRYKAAEQRVGGKGGSGGAPASDSFISDAPGPMVPSSNGSK